MNDQNIDAHAGHSPDTRPTSGLAIASLVLGILCLCLGPLALIPLILGVIGIMKTGASGTRKGKGFAIAGVVLGVLGMIGILVWVMIIGIGASTTAALAPALAKAREQANLLNSQTQVRTMLQSVVIYASDHNDQFPPVDQWPDAVVDLGLLDPEMLVSSDPDGDGVSYIYLGGWNSFSATEIVVYEDPDHWPDKGVIVGFADNHVEVINLETFEQMLEAQLED